MNWLAHVFLSDDDVDHQLGNLLADLVRGEARDAMSARFKEGAMRHHAIDVYTDAHPIVRRSRARVSAERRRFSGVLVDIFYDYFLASDWRRYSSIPLDEFTAAFYGAATRRAGTLPEPARATLERIARHDLLGSYRNVDGVARSLKRLSAYLASRWRREFALEAAIEDLRTHEVELRKDFEEFFPQLCAHVAGLQSRTRETGN